MSPFISKPFRTGGRLLREVGIDMGSLYTFAILPPGSVSVTCVLIGANAFCGDQIALLEMERKICRD